jgi:hypothetical protein
VYREHGLQGLFAGLPACLLGSVVVARLAAFAIADLLLPALQWLEPPSRPVSSRLASTVLPVLSNLCSYPLESVRVYQVMHPQASMLQAAAALASARAFFDGALLHEGRLALANAVLPELERLTHRWLMPEGSN